MLFVFPSGFGRFAAPFTDRGWEDTSDFTFQRIDPPELEELLEEAGAKGPQKARIKSALVSHILRGKIQKFKGISPLPTDVVLETTLTGAVPRSPSLLFNRSEWERRFESAALHLLNLFYLMTTELAIIQCRPCWRG